MLSLRSYLNEIKASFINASQGNTPIQYCISVPGRQVKLHFASPALILSIVPALAHLENLLPGAADIEFFIWDSSSSTITPPDPPFEAIDYHLYGQRAVADDGQIVVLHAPAIGLLAVYDRASRQGFFRVPSAQHLTIYDRAAPLQSLLHWALLETDWHIIHAAAVGFEDGGVLLVGNSGAGKSTTALSCLEHPELHFLSDDKCLATISPQPEAFGLYSSAKLWDDMLEIMPHFKPLVTEWAENESRCKGLVYLHPDFENRLVKRFPIKAIIVTRVANQSYASFEPARSKDVLKILGPSTLVWLPGAQGKSLNFITRLVGALDCYFMDLALDPKENSDAITSFIKSRQ